MRGKTITWYLALGFLSVLLGYGALLAGTLGHELTHLISANNAHVLEVNFDVSGKVIANSFDDDREEIAYLNGAVITTTIILIGQFSFIVLSGRNHE